MTHDQVEAMTMGEKIVVMKDGYVQQIADPKSLYDKPVNKFVAGFMGSPSMNFMEGKLEEKKGGLFFNEDNFEVRVPDQMAALLKNYVGQEMIMGLRPEDIHDKVYAAKALTDNTIKATVEVVEHLGAESYVYMTTSKTSFIAKMGSDANVEVNQEVELVFDMNKSHFFDVKTEKTII